MDQQGDFFTDEERQRLADHLDERGVRRICPQCGFNEMHFAGFVRQEVFARPNQPQTANEFTALVVVCGRCQHLMLHGQPPGGRFPV